MTRNEKKSKKDRMKEYFQRERKNTIELIVTIVSSVLATLLCLKVCGVL